MHDLSILSVDTFIKTPAAIFCNVYDTVVEIFAMCAHDAFFYYADKRPNFWKRTREPGVYVFVHVQDVPL